MKNYYIPLTFICLILPNFLVAQLMLYCVEGKATIIEDQQNAFINLIDPKTPFKAEISYDLNSKLLSVTDDKSRADYIITPNGGIKVFINNFIFQTNPSSREVTMAVANNESTLTNMGVIVKDYIDIISNANIFPEIKGKKLSENIISFSAKYKSNNALESTQLPDNLDFNKFNKPGIEILAQPFQTFEKLHTHITCVIDTIYQCSGILVLNESINSPSFSLVPNPSTTGLFHIEGEVTNMQVYNAQGNSIITPKQNDHTLDLSTFPRGMYMVVATVNGEMITKKVIRE